MSLCVCVSCGITSSLCHRLTVQQVMTEVGTIQSVLASGDIRVSFVGSHVWTLNSGAVVKVGRGVPKSGCGKEWVWQKARLCGARIRYCFSLPTVLAGRWQDSRTSECGGGHAYVCMGNVYYLVHVHMYMYMYIYYCDFSLPNRLVVIGGSTRTHAHTHVHTHSRTRTHARTHTLMHTHAHMHTHARMHTHAHAYTCTHTHACTHAHTCTHTYIHPHRRPTEQGTGCRPAPEP